MRAAALVAFAASLGLAVGCGPTCQSTCDHVYTQCNIDKAGRTRAELLRECRNSCSSAMQRSGELGDYNPDRRRLGNEPIELENDQQAVAWMDCVWRRAPEGTPEQCLDLDPSVGFCAPI